MNSRKKTDYKTMLFGFILLCVFVPLGTAAENIRDDFNTEPAAINDAVLSDKFQVKKQRELYYLQFKLLPYLTHLPNSTLIDELKNEINDSLLSIYAEDISPQYADAIEIHQINDLDGVFISYPEPSKTPTCYFTFIGLDKNKKSRYITYQRSRLKNESYNGTLGERLKDGSLTVYGTMPYKDLSNFIDDVKELIEN